jgi:hypothetical protein
MATSATDPSLVQICFELAPLRFETHELAFGCKAN